MATLGNKILTGASGREYRFKVFPLGTRFRKISGVYAIADRGRDAMGQPFYNIVYVGQTEDFSQPWGAHPKAGESARRGANCILVQSDRSEASREEKAQDLITWFQPKCND
jgi:hypothetical protein